VEVNKKYTITHSVYGKVNCEIIYIGKLAIYAKLLGNGGFWFNIEPGSEVRILKHKIKKVENYNA
jgi:hypothetical protein